MWSRLLFYAVVLTACQDDAQLGPRPATGDAAVPGDGAACVPACASRELFDRVCSCLSVCERGYLWDGRACLPEREADAGAPSATDGGQDATSPPDVGVGAPDGGACGDLLDNEDNCGACGRTCAGSCTGGVCTELGLDWVDSAPTRLQFLRSEVTVAEFAACVRAGACEDTFLRFSDDNACNYDSGRPLNMPMNCVDGIGARLFCSWVGGRLPTDDEWLAEASNNSTREYPWGDEAATCERAVMAPVGCNSGGTQPVCGLPAGNSVSGLCDMSGNVMEWNSTQTDRGERRALRGGGWTASANSVRAAAVNRYPVGLRSDTVGFRCVRPARP